MDRTTGTNHVVVDGKRQFTDGPPGTNMGAEFLNSVQEEIVGSIEEAGLTPSASNNQLIDVVRYVILTGGDPYYSFR